MKELIAIQSELKAPKGQTNKFGGYNYRSCEDILESVKPLLAKHGAALTLSDEIVQIGNDIFVKATATFYSSSPAPLCVSAFARHPVDKKGMDDSQITGATSSYARKYALNGLFCIDDTKDADATNDHGKGGVNYAASGTGKPPAGKTTRPEQKPAPQVPAQGQNQPQEAPPSKPPKPVTPEEKAAMLLRFMGTLGVDRESIESAIGAKVEEFTPEETGIVRNAALLMKKTGVDFQDAMTEVTR